MLPDERRNEVVDLVNERRGCSVETLAAELDVSAATVRRDLRELDEQGLIRRTHGGAMPAVDQRRPYERRIIRNREAKQAIAERAISEIHDDQVVCFDSGTTTLQIARQVGDDREFVVVTNGIMNAFEFARSGREVHLTGGMFRTDRNGVVGPWTEERLDGMRFDLLFLGTDGIDVDGLTNHSVSQAGVKQRMIASAARVVLVADAEKFAEEHFTRFAEPADIDLLITDGMVPDDIRDAFVAEGVELVEDTASE